MFLSNFPIWIYLIVVVSQMIIGALWYSPLLFGNAWLKLIGKRMEDISKKDANASMGFSLIPAVTLSFLLWLMVEWTAVQTIPQALILGTTLSLGFVGLSSLNLFIFEGRSLGLIFINVGYPLVAWNIATVIFTLWG